MTISHTPGVHYLPIESGIIFFSGFGVMFIFSTMLRIGFTEFIAKLDGLTFQVPLLTFILFDFVLELDSD